MGAQRFCSPQSKATVAAQAERALQRSPVAERKIHRDPPAPELQRTTAQGVPSPPAWMLKDVRIFPSDAPRSALSSTRLPGSGVLQAKLEIGAVDDPLEREADAVADRVMRVPDPALTVSPSPPWIARKCAACEEEEKQVRTKPAGAARSVGAAPPILHEVLRSPGRQLDVGTREFFERRFGYDFSEVRLHVDPTADAAAQSIGALAFTAGRDVAFRTGSYMPRSIAGKRLIAHELAHVVQQNRLGVTVLRSPVPDVSQPRTFIVAYGSGQLNPTTEGHNVGLLFQRVASQKLNEIKARLGHSASKHTFVFAYTPTEAELKNVLNKKYSAPIAEIHIFSHGWSEGVNLGGYVPQNVKRTTSNPDDAEQRRLTAADLGAYDIELAQDAIAVFYGCNIGNVREADKGQPFAKAFSEEFGISVTASTTSTHFEDKSGWHQVPDVGGRMQKFTPTPDDVRSQIAEYKRLLSELATSKAEQPKGGLIGVMMREERLGTAINRLRDQINRKRPVIQRLIRFLSAAEGSNASKDVAEAERRAGLPEP